MRGGSRSGRPQGRPRSAAAGHHPVAKKKGGARGRGFSAPQYPHPALDGCPRTPWARAGACGQPCPHSRQRVRGQLGAASVDTPWPGWRRGGVVREQRDPCLSAGDKMGRRGQPHSPRCLNAASLPMAPDICSGQECREGNQVTPGEWGHPMGTGTPQGDTPGGQRAAPSATVASTNCSNWVPPFPQSPCCQGKGVAGQPGALA